MRKPNNALRRIIESSLWMTHLLMQLKKFKSKFFRGNFHHYNICIFVGIAASFFELNFQKLISEFFCFCCKFSFAFFCFWVACC